MSNSDETSHKASAGSHSEDNDQGISDDQLPDDVRPDDDNPLAKGPLDGDEDEDAAP